MDTVSLLGRASRDWSLEVWAPPQARAARRGRAERVRMSVAPCVGRIRPPAPQLWTQRPPENGKHMSSSTYVLFREVYFLLDRARRRARVGGGARSAPV